MKITEVIDYQMPFTGQQKFAESPLSMREAFVMKESIEPLKAKIKARIREKFGYNGLSLDVRWEDLEVARCILPGAYKATLTAVIEPELTATLAPDQEL